MTVSQDRLGNHGCRGSNSHGAGIPGAVIEPCIRDIGDAEIAFINGCTATLHHHERHQPEPEHPRRHHQSPYRRPDYAPEIHVHQEVWSPPLSLRLDSPFPTTQHHLVTNWDVQ
jgi:hypothetical protein